MAENFQSESGAITFLDVLGWKGIWRKKGNEALDSFTKLVTSAENIKEKIISSLERYYPKERGNNDFLKIISLSDTIVIISVAEIESALWATSQVVKALMPLSIRESIPLRGACTYGQLNYDFKNGKSLLIGPAVDEAASWHEHVDWIGVHLTPSTAMGLIKVNTEKIGWEVYSRLPSKTGNAGDAYCLNWYPDWIVSSSKFENALEELNIAFKQNGPMVPEISKYYLNTLAFCNSENVKKNSEKYNLNLKTLKITPSAKSFDEPSNSFQDQRDDNWRIENVNRDGIEIHNCVTDHVYKLAWLDIEKINPDSLSLKVNLGLRRNGIEILN